jgi:hypothetical protein
LGVFVSFSERFDFQIKASLQTNTVTLKKRTALYIVPAT